MAASTDRATHSRTRMELQAVLQTLPEAVFLLDANSRIVDVNPAAEQLIGQAEQELLGEEAEVLSSRIMGPAVSSTRPPIVARALEGEQVRHERRIFQAGTSRESVEVMVSGSPMYDTSHRLLGALIVIEDISEISALQKQVASSERHFAVGQMTAGLAHDFNNILATISDALCVLQMERNRSQRDRAMLTIITNAVHRGSEIVNNIREYLRGNWPLRSRVDVQRLLEEVLLLSQPMLEMHPHIKVQHELNEGCEVDANAPELRRVFTNLALNAVDAMPQGGTLTVRCARNGERVIVSVEDTGTGIPAAARNRIFSPYFTTKAKGTGLGLSGARSAIQAQGGDIRFESSPGKGTTFFISLPVATERAQELRAA